MPSSFRHGAATQTAPDGAAPTTAPTSRELPNPRMSPPTPPPGGAGAVQQDDRRHTRNAVRAPHSRSPQGTAHDFRFVTAFVQSQLFSFFCWIISLTYIVFNYDFIIFKFDQVIFNQNKSFLFFRHILVPARFHPHLPFLHHIRPAWIFFPAFCCWMIALTCNFYV